MKRVANLIATALALGGGLPPALAGRGRSRANDEKNTSREQARRVRHETARIFRVEFASGAARRGSPEGAE